MKYDFGTSTAGTKYDFGGDSGQTPATPLNIPYASTPIGVATNTVLGLPQAALTVAKDVGQGLARDFFGIGLSLGNAINTFLGRDTTTEYKPTNNIDTAILGEPTNDIGTRVVQAEQAIKSSPLAQRLGLDKAAGPLAFGGVIGSVGLDFLGGGGEEAVAKQLLKETTEEGALKILAKIKAPEDVAKTFAPEFAKATTPADVNQLMNLMRGKIGAESVAKETSVLADKGINPSGEHTDQNLQTPPSPQLGTTLPPAEAGLKQGLTSPISIAQSEQQGQLTINKMTQALKEAEPVRGQQETLYSQARSERLTQAIETGKTTSGESGFYSELGKLKGELPKAQFSSIRPQFSQPEIDSVFNTVKNSPTLGEWDKMAARNGLVKLFGETGGTVPTENEISLLSRVFGKDFTDSVMAKRPLWNKITEGISNALNVPRAIMASFDLSAPLRQGLFLIDKPQRWFQSFGTMFKTFGSEKAFQAVQDSIAKDPLYNLMQESKLALTNLERSLGSREEQFMSNWAEKIPVVGKVVRASGRAYEGFLNTLRANVFSDLVNKAKTLGLNPEKNVDLAHSIAKFVNTSSGRGSLGSFERAAVALNTVFFSPRLMASRLNILNPKYYIDQPAFVRKEALKSLFTVTGMVTSVLTLSSMAGAKVVTDPRNADFGKIKIGNTRIDIAGGFLQYIRIAAQLITGKLISSTTGKEYTFGEGYKPLTRLDIVMNALKNKESPIASFITNILSGTDATGKKIKPSSEIVNRFTPMIAQDVVDLAHSNPDLLPVSVLGIFGAGIQTYSGTSGNTPKLKYQF